MKAKREAAAERSGGIQEWKMEDGRWVCNEMRGERDYVKFQIVFCHFHSVCFSHRSLTFPASRFSTFVPPCYCLPCSIERQTDIRLSHLHTAMREGRIVCVCVRSDSFATSWTIFKAFQWTQLAC